MYTQLLDYGDFRCFDLSGETDLAAIPIRVFVRLAQTSCPTLNRHLFNALIQTKSLRALRTLRVQDKRVDLSKKDLFVE